MGFSTEQRAMLDAPLDPKLVKIKPTPGSPKYIEGHEAMNNANHIFGYDGWGYTVDRLDRMEAPGGVLYTALVSVTVEGCHTKQDIGVEIASNTKDGKAPGVQAHDTAIKGAVTDGVKRALRSFGDQFGASLYDKDADLQGEYRDWQREQGKEPTDQHPARPAAPPARTVTTPAGGATTPPRGNSDPWNIQAEVREEIAARQAAAPIPFQRAVEGDLQTAEQESIASVKEKVRLAAREAGYTLGTWKDWVQLGLTLQYPVPDAANSAALTVAWCKATLERLPAPAGVS